jgi:hypothetical protein
MLSFDYSKALGFISEEEIYSLAPDIRTAHEMLHNGTGAGHEYTGWVELPAKYDRQEFESIKQAAAKIRDLLAVYYQNYDLISIGAYKPGMNHKLDEAVKKIDAINAFLCQKTNEKFSFDDVVQIMKEL